MKKKDIFILSICMFVLGSLLHFLYEVSNNNFIIGLIVSKNESIFEHTKLMILPIIICYVVYYLKNKNNKDLWFSKMIINILVSIICIPLLYYTYSGMSGLESTFIDIAIYYISGLIGLVIASRFNKEINWKLYLIIIVLVFILLSLFPLNIPFFNE